MAIGLQKHYAFKDPVLRGKQAQLVMDDVY
jgi:hypothetical protein